MSERFPRELWDEPTFHKGREWGRMEERERIIELLRERWSLTEDVVALIRGENK